MNSGQVVVDLNRSDFTLANAANMIFRSTLKRHICVFQNPLFFKKSWKRDYGRNS